MTNTINEDIKTLLDEREIRNQLYTYCRAVDRCDEELLRSLYHADAHEEHGAYTGPVDGFIRFAMDTMGWMECGAHHLTNILIDIKGDVAYAESSFLSISANATDPEGVPIDLIISGRYLDKFEKRGGPWRIAHRRLVFDTNHTVEAGGKWSGALYESFKPRGRKDRDDPIYTWGT